MKKYNKPELMLHSFDKDVILASGIGDSISVGEVQQKLGVNSNNVYKTTWDAMF